MINTNFLVKQDKACNELTFIINFISDILGK